MFAPVALDTSHDVSPLPNRTLLDAAVEIAGSDGSATCGDAASVRELSDGTTAVVVVDVAGHGAPLAHLSYYLGSHVMASLALGSSPGIALALADREFRLERDRDGPAFATVFAAVVDSELGGIRYASAGHHSAMIVAPDGTWSTLRVTGPALGLPMIPAFGEHALGASDARLVVTTDGVTESRDCKNCFFGDIGIVRAVSDASGAAAAARAILEGANRHARGRRLDDQCAVVLGLPAIF